MTFEEALAHVRSFWPPREVLPFGPGDADQVVRLEQEYGRALPVQLRAYVAEYAPMGGAHLRTVGNPIELYAPSQLAARVDGYSWDPVANCSISDWSDAWLLIGDEGGDPIIIDLDRPASGDHCAVLRALHGRGEWDFYECASSIPVFLVLAAAQHHALARIVSELEAIVDDQSGFNLNEAAASWYFPFLRRVAPEFYDQWAGIFDNA